MIALPKAISHGSNAAGGGALTAFNGISAARAEPDTIASAVANITNFFMTIPITFPKISPIPAPPRASDNRLQRNSLTWPQFGTRHPYSEAKKTSICRLFRRNDVSRKGCRNVLHLDNNFDRFQCPLGDISVTSWARIWRVHDQAPRIRD